MIAPVALGVGAGLLAALLPGRSTVLIPGARLISGTPFGMTGTVAGLAPGVPSTLTVNISNTSFNEPVTVTSVTVQATSIPSGCPVANLTVNGAAFTGSSPPQVVVSGSSTPPLAATSPSPVPMNGSATIPIPIELVSGAANPGCQNVSFGFTFQGQGVYTDTTTTVLATGVPQPSYPGNPIAFTATVTPANASMDSYGPGSASETGTKQVNFFYCSISSCTPATPTSPGSAALGTNNQATLSTSGFTSPGTYYLDAQYPGSGSNLDFSGSTSNVVTQVVQFAASCVTPPTTTATTKITTTINGNYTVASGTSVWLNGGTITGILTVPATSSFAATGGTIGGSISSAGPLSLQGTKVGGNLASTGGGVAIGPGTVIGGSFTPSGSGTSCAIGTSPSPITISGNVNVQNLPKSSVPDSLCGLSVKGNLTYSSNGAPVQIGGSSSCPGDTISGNLVVQSNTAAVTIGGSGYGNSTGGGIAVSANAGGTLTSNSAGGTCSLSGDNPKIVGSGNTAKGKNTCNGTA